LKLTKVSEELQAQRVRHTNKPAANSVLIPACLAYSASLKAEAVYSFNMSLKLLPDYMTEHFRAFVAIAIRTLTLT
jgi:hypothetical protein